MIYRKIFFFLLLVTGTSTALAQLSLKEKEMLAPTLSYKNNLDHSLEFYLQGLPSSQDVLPFWMHHNSRGRISQDSHMAAWLSGKKLTYITDKSYLLFGGGILYRDGTNDGILMDELFAHFQNSFLYITAGQKQRPEIFNGLSASNEHILWSLNARPLPGIQIGTAQPIHPFPSNWLGFEAAWNEYLTGEDGYVQDAKIHHKKFHLVFNHRAWQLKLGFEHFAQWGGTSPRMGDQPADLENYLKVIAGKEGTVEAAGSGKINTIGNHLGGYDLYLTREFRNYTLQFFYNHIFEDISGRRLKNLPDGRYGIFYDHKEKDRLLSSVIYELYYTHHQSYTSPGFHKHDNYFNNGTYQSGWTYEGRVFGAPFFTPDPDGKGVINNKFMAHHIGLAGEIGNYFRTFPYKILLSYAHNDGRYNRRFRPQQDVFYGLAEARLLDKVISLNLQVGIELNSTSPPIYGAGMNLRYRFF